MKRTYSRLTVLLLSALLLFACSDSKKEPAKTVSVEQSAVWNLGKRYDASYSTLTYIVTYEADGEPFCLRINRSKKPTGSSTHVVESKTVDGTVYALCEDVERSTGKTSYTYYECYTGSFRYFVGRENDGFRIEKCLSMNDAIALIAAPETPTGSVTLSEVEWDAYYRNSACNLEIVIRPNDQGAMLRSPEAGYTPETEGDETYYVSDRNDAIMYTDGVHSIHIRQANRSGADPESYHTLSECKAILALLKTDPES